jgi:hypothetical protein
MSFALLSNTPNPKIEKGKALNYYTFVLHLAPAKLSGFNVCPMATEGCKAACLNTAGRGGMMKGHARLTADDVANGIHNTIQAARIRRTRLFFTDRAGFMAALVSDIRKAISKAQRKGMVPAFRLNGTSDIRWETIAVEGAANVFALFPEVQFYDYTKIANRKGIPANYHLTFSLADGNDKQAQAALANGMNVAAVFRSKQTSARYIAEGFNGAPVVSGDDTDLRFLDPRGVVVALYAKGNAKSDTSGFVRD